MRHNHSDCGSKFFVVVSKLAKLSRASFSFWETGEALRKHLAKLYERFELPSATGHRVFVRCVHRNLHDLVSFQGRSSS